MENHSNTSINTTSSSYTGSTGSIPHDIQEYKIILYCILLVWSLVGNILVLAVIFYNKDLRNSFNYLVVNMTISDLLCPLVSLPVRIYIAIGVKSWPGGLFGDILCKSCYFLIDISPCVSAFTLAVVAFERFSATYSSHLYVLNKKKTSISITLTWIVAMAIYSSYFYGYEVSSDHECELNIETKYRTVFYTVLIVAVFVIPFVCITTMYTAMFIRLRQASTNITNMLDSRQARYRHIRNQRIFRLSLIIILAFAALWGPFFGFLFVWTYVWKFQAPSYVDSVKIISIVDILGLTNACINPCIYFLFQKNYRHGLRRIWRVLMRRSSRRKPDDHENVNLTKNKDTNHTAQTICTNKLYKDQLQETCL